MGESTLTIPSTKLCGRPRCGTNPWDGLRAEALLLPFACHAFAGTTIGLYVFGRAIGGTRAAVLRRLEIVEATCLFAHASGVCLKRGCLVEPGYGVRGLVGLLRELGGIEYVVVCSGEVEPRRVGRMSVRIKEALRRGGLEGVEVELKVK